MKKIAIIGVGGRTGTMFAFELRKSTEILGVGRKEEVEKIKDGKIYLQRKNEKPVKFEEKVIADYEFNEEINPDFIFLCVKNPIGPAVNYYYQKFKNRVKIPTLVLSQNGISAIEDAERELEKIFGKRAKEIRILRVSLFNPISGQKIDDKISLSYFLPIRLAFAVASGSKEIIDIKEIFKKADIEAEEISPANIKNMEFSKLFTNLIGMASAVKGQTIEEGFSNDETFKEEIMSLKEYIKVVRKSGGKFLNFKHYPIRLITFLINFLPTSVLKVFKKIFVKAITRGRGGKEKGNLDEIDYYNGMVARLGQKLGIETSINQKILNRASKKL